VYGDHLFYTDDGFVIADISIPSDPVIQGTYDLESSGVFAVGAAGICYVNADGGLTVLPPQCDVGVSIDHSPFESPPETPGTDSLTCAPNPFNPSTTMTYTLFRPGIVKLAIFDVAGRLVRELVNGPQGEGQRSVSWDGLDEQGRMAPSGAYFARLITSDRIETRCLTLLK